MWTSGDYALPVSEQRCARHPGQHAGLYQPCRLCRDAGMAATLMKYGVSEANLMPLADELYQKLGIDLGRL